MAQIENATKTTKKPRILLWCILGVILLAAVAGGTLFLLNRFQVVIDLRGGPQITVEYGSNYQEPGVEARLVGTLFFRTGFPTEVTTAGHVNTQQLGTYQITYTAKSLWYGRKAERTVSVVDTQPPVIALASSPDTFTIPGESYQEEGYTAFDNCDGDLTAQVVRQEQDGVVTYQVQDASGNAATVQRQIVYYDPIPPELTLAGDTEMSLTAGHAYEEPGYTAIDNCDGDLTEKVSVTGSVDIYQVGTYPLEYRVEDQYGNAARAVRTVTVVPVRQPDTVDPGEKVIYLTFDDGPGEYTEQLLDILDKYNVKATFFLVNNGYYDTLKRMAREGHSLAMHAGTHQYKTIYASEEAYFEDLNTIHSVILEQTGTDTTLLRFPGGSSNTVSSFNKGIMSKLTAAVTDMGYQYFDWNVDSNDAGGACSADEVFNNVVKGIGSKNTAVVLQHDVKRFSVDAVERIIIWGLDNGYTFLPLDATSPPCHHGVNN